MSDLISREALYEATKDTTDVSYMAAMILCAPAVDAVEVVRCKGCIWFVGKHILHNDGTKTFVDIDSPLVSMDVGINVQAKCSRHYYSNDNHFVHDDGNDYCSYGERRESEAKA